jgi:hypothetical protein
MESTLSDHSGGSAGVHAASDALPLHEAVLDILSKREVRESVERCGQDEKEAAEKLRSGGARTLHALACKSIGDLRQILLAFAPAELILRAALRQMLSLEVCTILNEVGRINKLDFYLLCSVGPALVRGGFLDDGLNEAIADEETLNTIKSVVTRGDPYVLPPPNPDRGALSNGSLSLLTAGGK